MQEYMGVLQEAGLKPIQANFYLQIHSLLLAKLNQLQRLEKVLILQKLKRESSMHSSLKHNQLSDSNCH